MTKVGQMLRFAHARDAALLLAAGFALLGAPQEAFAQAAPAKQRGASSALGGLGGDSKEPIKIDADKLDVVDKENKAVFSGNVVAVQGETTVRCTVMTVLYEGRGGPGGPGAAPDGAGYPPGGMTPAYTDLNSANPYYSIASRWALAPCSFGSVSVSTPLSYLALAWAASTSTGSWKLRATEPK